MRIRTDHIGRPVFATNDLGVKVWEASYLPFGGVHVATGGIDLRFPGQWFQAESGLYQNWMRDYDPTTGRYLEADPLGLVDGASVYGYGRQNPERYVDPRGERVYVMCRPTTFISFLNHCSLIVIVPPECTCAGEQEEYVFTVGRWSDRFNEEETTPDRDRFYWHMQRLMPTVRSYYVPPPKGQSSCDFDAAVIIAANEYRNPYWPTGPNSNTAVRRAIEAAGGTPPTVSLAPGYSWVPDVDTTIAP